MSFRWPLFLIMLSFILGCDQSGVTSNTRQLALNICLSDASKWQMCDQCQEARATYFSDYWLDTTKQFFTKTLVSSDYGDTLFVTVTDGISNQQLISRINERTDIIFESKWHNNGLFRVFGLFGKINDRFLARYVFEDEAFDDFMIIDLVKKDSVSVSNHHKLNLIPKMTEPCL